MSIFSPVNKALFTLRSSHSMILISAGTFSPLDKITISPIVNSSAKILVIIFPLKTSQFNGDSYLITSIVFSAFPS